MLPAVSIRAKETEMSDIYFKCLCGKSLAVEEVGIGASVVCVDCGRPVEVPEPEIEFECEECGTELLAPLSIVGERIKCTLCGYRMTAPAGTNSGSWADRRIMEEPIISDAKRCMDEFMRCRRENLERHKTPPRRTYTGLLVWIAVLAITVVAVMELIRIRPGGVVAWPARTAVEARMDAGMAQVSQETPTHEIADENHDWEKKEAEDHAWDLAAIGEVQGDESAAGIKEPSSPLPLDNATSEQVMGDSPRILDSDDNSGEKSFVVVEKGRDTRLMKRVAEVGKMAETDRRKFDAAVPGLWSEILEYTRTHSGKALDEINWGCSFRTAGEWMLDDNTLDYKRSLALIQDGVTTLRDIEAENEVLPARLAMGLAMMHAERWMRSHVLEGAALIDDMWEWVKSLGDPSLRRACFARTLFFDGNLLINRFSVPEEDRSLFIEEREKKLWEFLDDEELSFEQRTVALSHWAWALRNAGRSSDALKALETWRQRHDGQIVSARYYHMLVEVSLWGLGDWETASRSVHEAGRHREKWRTSHDHWSFGEMCRIYYNNMLFNGYETMRVGSVRAREYEEKMRLLARNATGR